MARNYPGKSSETQTETKPAPEAVDDLDKFGGTSGQPDAAQVTSDGLPLHSAKRGSTSIEINPKKLRVTGTTGKRDAQTGAAVVMYDGQSTRLSVGKILTDAHCDIDHLKKQGVTFEEIIDEPKE